MWFPHADAEELQTVGRFVAWRFLVDDALNRVCAWSDEHDLAAFDALCKGVADFAHVSMDVKERPPLDPRRKWAPGVEGFTEVAAALNARLQQGESPRTMNAKSGKASSLDDGC